MGIGGTPEGVISAAAIKCLGGAIQGKLWPRNDEERQALVDDGYDLDRVLTHGRPRRRRRRVRRGDRRHRRRAPARRPLHGRRRRHGVDRHALALGHDAPDRGDAPLGQARRRSPASATGVSSGTDAVGVCPAFTPRPFAPGRASTTRSARGRSSSRGAGTPACPAGRSSASPPHAFSAGACSARPYENDSSHGCGPIAFIAFRCAVASSSVWPPERKTIPGTAAGTCRRKHLTVCSATSWMPARSDAS